MMNIYNELFLINEDNSENTLEFELSLDIKNEIGRFLKEKYRTTLEACCMYDEEYSRVVVTNEKNYFDEILGGDGQGKREHEFIKYLNKRGK